MPVRPRASLPVALLAALASLFVPFVALAAEGAGEKAAPEPLFATPIGVGALSGAVLVVAFLVNRFARTKRRHIRRMVLLWLVFALTFGVGTGVGAGGKAVAAGHVLFVAEIFAYVTVINISALLVFDLVLLAVGVRPAAIVADLSVGIAYFVVLVVALRRAGVDPSSLAAAGGALTAILAFSFQQTLGNVLGGVALQADNSIRVGDWIQLDSGKQGKVTQIRWRHTVIETRDWDTVIVPNAALLSANIIILGKREGQPLQHRMWVYFNVDFRFSPEVVVRVVEQALHAAPIVGVATDPPPNCICYDMARDHRDSFGYYAVRYWLTDLARDDPTSSRVRERVYKALKRADIPLAVPAAQIWVEEDTVERRERKRHRELDQRVAALSGIDLMKPLTRDELIVLAKDLSYAPFAAGETITKQGAVAHWLYVMTQGSVEIRVSSEAGERAVARIDSPGFFGEMSLMTGEPRSATVVAIDEVDCYRLDKEQFTRIMSERPRMAAEISEVLARRQVEIQAVREHLDAAARERCLEAEKSRLYASIRGFFGLGEDTNAS